MNDRSEVVVVGGGFAGVWAAAAAAAARDDAGAGRDGFRITMVTPGSDLVIRPGLYQGEPHRKRTGLDAILRPVGVRRVAATVTGLDLQARRITATNASGDVTVLGYRRLVLAPGSQLAAPRLDGARYLFDVDTIGAAARLDAHLRHLRASPGRPGRGTAVVIGAGFTGIEVAAELITRLQAVTGPGGRPRVILVEATDLVGPELGPGPRQVIEAALAELGVEVRLGQRLRAVTGSRAAFADGSSVACATVVWTAGMMANQLTGQVPGQRDRLGRLLVDRYLRVPTAPAVFAAGDAAAAACPDGHPVLQSCQHAIPLGKFAGHNAAAGLLGQPVQRFDPGPYITCLDLGAAGAVVTTGWDREVRLTGAPAKTIKKAIVDSYIYPPSGDAGAVLAMARAREHPPLPL